MTYAHLSQRSVIALSGPDAAELLQGIVSNDVRRAVPGQALYAALLSPQGKFLHDMFIVAHEHGLWLDVAATSSADLLQRLKLYRLRSKVEIVLAPELSVFAVWGEGAAVAGCFADPRLAAMGVRAIGSLDILEAALAAHNHARVDEAAYERHRLEHSVPDGSKDMLFDKSLLLEFGFEQLGGVDFAKGCYVGQEVTARSKYRAQLRKQLYAVCIGEALPPLGTPIMHGDKEVGQLRSVAGRIGLAIVQVEEVEASQTEKTPLVAGGITMQLALPKWMRPVSDNGAEEAKHGHPAVPGGR